MKDKKCFIDSNLIIYLYAGDNDIKRNTLLSMLDIENESFISQQVINETCNILIKKFNLKKRSVEKVVLELSEAFGILKATLKTTLKTLELHQKFKYSFWDSMILATAIENNCNIVYSEDMQHGQKIGNKLTIINPFKK